MRGGGGGQGEGVRLSKYLQGEAEALCLELSWALPYEPLPLADFNWYLLLFTNCHHEMKSFQCVLGPFSYFWSVWVVLGTFKPAVGIRREGGLVDRTTCHFTTGLLLSGSVGH